MPWGTVVNVATVIAGSLIGMLLKRGLPKRFKDIIFSGIGLVTIVIGLLNALAVGESVPSAAAVPRHLMVVIFSILIGGLLGEAIGIEKWLDHFGDQLKQRVRGAGERFTEGLVVAFLIYCVGPLTILGSLNEGIQGDASLLYIKATLDGFMSIALASTFGIGVLFSFIPLFIFQAGITLAGAALGNFFSPVLVNQLTAVGGVLILGLGINILGLKQIKVANLLPALVVVVILTLIFG
ncbi:MAG TPA: DUF554 domain-containing protein [Firmicutes bacterium]|nr:DUF554 domain-containing protein [Bacillota bacterium]